MKYALIVEDMPESQELLAEVAQTAFPGIQTRCVAGVGVALAEIENTRYDLALIDLALPDGDGTAVVQAMAQCFPHCTIVVATLFGDDDHLFPALRAGARGYLLKDQPPELLVRQLRGIREGHPPLSPSIARRLLDHFRETSGAAQEAGASLTPRERDVLGHLARGVSIANIGAELGISRHTVGDHVKSIYRKLNIASRAQAALQAKHLGLV